MADLSNVLDHLPDTAGAGGSEDEEFNMDDLESLNTADGKELECLVNFLHNPFNQLTDGDGTLTGAFCNSTWDGILCWPTTAAGATSVLPCFEELNGIKYDTTQNATRLCLDDGTWANRSDYGSCVPLEFGLKEPETGVSISEDTTTIFFTGYTVSIVALTVALWIFTRYKDLRCLRNTIHTHLLITYIMANLLWILAATLQLYRGETNRGSCIIVIFLHYFHLTNFFWMFVEGFYLYMLVVETFSAERIRLRTYALIGWGVPLPVVIVWAVVKANWFDYSTNDSQQGGQKNLNMSHFSNSCPWMVANSYDWIYMTPAIGVLFVNILFLIKIMWVLITKLRSTNSVETQQYRKGSKALLVLFPLLGITYVLVIAGPTEGTVAVYFSHIRAVLLSTQGFLVTLFFCFLNTEVRNTVRHHWLRWKTSRGLGRSNRGNRSRFGGPANNNRHAKEGSSNITESTRLYGGRNNIGRNHSKRDISITELTTVTSYPRPACHGGGNGSGDGGSNSSNHAVCHLDEVVSHGSNGHSTLIASTRLANGTSTGVTVTAIGRPLSDSSNILIAENQV